MRQTRVNSGGPGDPGRLGEYVGDHFAVDIGQPSLDSVVVDAETAVLKSSQVQDGGVDIMNTGGVFDRPVSERVGGTVGKWSLDTCPGHPDGESVGIVVSPTGPLLERGHAAEFAAEDDQGLFEQSALLEIGQQPGGGLIENRAVDIVLHLEFLVAVPVAGSFSTGLVAAVEELDETNTSFDQPACQQTVAGEAGFQGISGVGTVESDRRTGFGREVGDLGDRQLHACRELVTGDSGGQFGVTGETIEVFLIEGIEKTLSLIHI